MASCTLGPAASGINLQALLSRGDRRLSRLLHAARSHGDSLGSFRRAFKELEGEIPPMEYYAQHDYQPEDNCLPWQHIQGPLPSATLMKHREEAVGFMV